MNKEKENQKEKIDFLAGEIYKNSGFGRTLNEIKRHVSPSIAIGHLLIKNNELVSYGFASNGFPVYFNSENDEFVILKKTNNFSKRTYRNPMFDHNVSGAYFYMSKQEKNGFFVHLDMDFLRIGE